MIPLKKIINIKHQIKRIHNDSNQIKRIVPAKHCLIRKSQRL